MLVAQGALIFGALAELGVIKIPSTKNPFYLPSRDGPFRDDWLGVRRVHLHQ
jgi:hypothetical protein